jgi:maltose alpha-D-glucosyltransferase/alpha-amylase
VNVVSEIKAEAKLESDELWFKDAIIYQLHVKAFVDSNGDGIGDFAGLTEKLDYLQDLGVTALWLLPFYFSPGRDDGYDISDYNRINSDFGAMQDFRRFVQEAKRRKLRVISELVINHTSDQHPWFQRARGAKPDSAARNWYVWSDSDQRYAGTRIIFNEAEKIQLDLGSCRGGLLLAPVLLAPAGPQFR